MTWWTDGQGNRGFFSDEGLVPVGWTRIPDPEELAEATPPQPAENVDDTLVEGNVREIADSIDADTDLDALEAAEKDREVPRKGVLSAIEKERAAREKA